MSDLHPIGDVVVKFTTRPESSGELTVQLRAIHEQFIAGRDADTAYGQMGLLAAKAVQRCHVLEGELYGAHRTAERPSDRGPRTASDPGDHGHGRTRPPLGGWRIP